MIAQCKKNFVSKKKLFFEIIFKEKKISSYTPESKKKNSHSNENDKKEK